MRFIPSKNAISLCLVVALAYLLGGCAGPFLAKQIASSVAWGMADKATAAVVEAQEKKNNEPRHIDIMNTEPDPYLAKFLAIQFPDQQVEEVRIEPLPKELTAPEPAVESNRLVSVEVWNVILGKDKQIILDRARFLNASHAIAENISFVDSDYKNWQVASGGLVGHKETAVTFLVPPDFGKVKSGDLAIVEIAPTGGIHIARYRAN